MKFDPNFTYVLIGIVILVVFLLNRRFSKKDNEAFDTLDLKTISKHGEGWYIEFRAQKVDVRLPGSEGCPKCENGYHLTFESDVENLMSISTVGRHFFPLNWRAPYPYFDTMIWDQPFAVAAKDREVFEQLMTSIKIKNAVTTLFKRMDGRPLKGFLTVRDEAHITLKGLVKKQEVHFSSVPLTDFRANPNYLTRYLDNLFDLIEEVKAFNVSTRK